MRNKTEKKRRRFFRKNFAEKINGDASRALKLEIFRLAKIRDTLGVILIVSIIVIITLSILLFKHW
jgi:hypothetical protein